MKNFLIIIAILSVLAIFIKKNQEEKALQAPYSSGGYPSSYQPRSYGSTTYSSDEEGDEDYDEEGNEYDDEGIDDGTHSATVRYYNPKTGHYETYTLDVDVEDGAVRQLNFPRGGWLDESHISSGELEDGETTIYDDEGREFEVEIEE